MMSHVHLVPTETARRRVIQMGEEEWRVHRVGAPSLDHLRRSEIPGRGEIEQHLGIQVSADTVVVAFHPVTLDRDPAAEVDPFFRAIERIDRPLVFCFPNADAGSYQVQERARELCAKRDNAHLFVHLPHLVYWGLLEQAAAIIGNSSSGIMEAPSVPLPTVNVGRRQQGRERARSVIDTPAEVDRILAALERALEPRFRESLAGVENPYGDGHAGERIAEVLASVELGPGLLEKRGVVV